MPHTEYWLPFITRQCVYAERISLYLHPKKRTHYYPEVDHDSIHS